MFLLETYYFVNDWNCSEIPRIVSGVLPSWWFSAGRAKPRGNAADHQTSAQSPASLPPASPQEGSRVTAAREGLYLHIVLFSCQFMCLFS